jgi:sugar/nucleoside kinase (ribokinase family)
MGRDGAWIASGEKLHRIEPLIVSDVIDTNGAGDAWASGFLYGYLRDWALPVCGTLASLIGAETVRHLGPIIPAEHWARLLPRAHALSPK